MISAVVNPASNVNDPVSDPNSPTSTQSGSRSTSPVAEVSASTSNISRPVSRPVSCPVSRPATQPVNLIPVLPQLRSMVNYPMRVIPQPSANDERIRNALRNFSVSTSTERHPISQLCQDAIAAAAITASTQSVPQPNIRVIPTEVEQTSTGKLKSLLDLKTFFFRTHFSDNFSTTNAELNFKQRGFFLVQLSLMDMRAGNPERN